MIEETSRQYEINMLKFTMIIFQKPAFIFVNNFYQLEDPYINAQVVYCVCIESFVYLE